jgi:hygromycin-B 7''-O-kinase
LVDEIAGFLRRVDPLARLNPVLLHTEVLDEHVLVVEEGGVWRPSALIDFADGRVGHPFYEFGALIEFIFKGEPGCLRACLEAYGTPPDAFTDDLENELLAWYLLHQFGDLARLTGVAGDPEPKSLEALRERLFNLRDPGRES